MPWIWRFSAQCISNQIKAMHLLAHGTRPWAAHNKLNWFARLAPYSDVVTVCLQSAVEHMLDSRLNALFRSGWSVCSLRWAWADRREGVTAASRVASHTRATDTGRVCRPPHVQHQPGGRLLVTADAARHHSSGCSAAPSTRDGTRNARNEAMTRLPPATAAAPAAQAAAPTRAAAVRTFARVLYAEYHTHKHTSTRAHAHTRTQTSHPHQFKSSEVHLLAHGTWPWAAHNTHTHTAHSHHDGLRAPRFSHDRHPRPVHGDVPITSGYTHVEPAVHSRNGAARTHPGAIVARPGTRT